MALLFLLYVTFQGVLEAGRTHIMTTRHSLDNEIISTIFSPSLHSHSQPADVNMWPT